MAIAWLVCKVDTTVTAHNDMHVSLKAVAILVCDKQTESVKIAIEPTE